jgi:hypothetical protein
MGLLFYSRALLRTGASPEIPEVDFLAHAFTAIVTLLQMYTDTEDLVMLRITPEVASLIIRLWALEVKGSPLATQLRDFTSHNLVQPLGLIGALPDAYRTIWLAFETYARKHLRFLIDDESKVMTCSNEEACLSHPTNK